MSKVASQETARQMRNPFKPKAKNADWDESTWSYEEEEWHDYQWESEEYEASKGKKGKGKGSRPKGKSKGEECPTIDCSKAYAVFTDQG